MINKKVAVSLIIVHYHAKDVLFNCIRSILKSSPKMKYEIIVVDNDETIQIKNELKKLFPKVIYIKSPKNTGFGAGVNFGATYAHGNYICMLNPDVLIVDDTIRKLYEFVSKKKDAGIASAVLLDAHGKMPEKLGGTELTPLKAIFTFSLIHKLFPHNGIAKKFWVNRWDLKNIKHATSIPLGAAILKKSLFDKINGFDEHFFLYFEDFDFDKRVEEAGYKNYLLGDARVIHLGGKGGTAEVKNLSTIYKQSRFYYFKKHFGLLTALFTEMILQINKYSLLFTGVFLLSIVLLFYHLADLMMFIGDQGWFYLSARDMLLTGLIPLVGITSSHVWLHQGPFWTYFLALALWISHFNPVSGAYLTAMIGLFTVWLVYKIGSEMFSPRVGLIASLIYATTPLTVFFARMPYHTEPIAPLTLLLFYTIYKWTKGYRYGFPVIIFLLTLLYNFETATFMLVPIVIFVLVYGIYKKADWIKNCINKKIILLSVLAWLAPMIPMILYDIHHGYPQTVKFAVWVVYKIATVFGYPKLHEGPIGESFQTMSTFASAIIRRIFFFSNSLVAWFILAISFINLSWITKKYFDKNDFLQQYSLLFLFFIIPAIAYIAEKTNSDAYWVVFFPTFALMLALVFERLMQFGRFFYLGFGFLTVFAALNIISLFQSNFLMNPNAYGFTLSQRLATAKEIVQESKGKEYNLRSRGAGSQYENAIMNYIYLTWWLGKGPSKTNQPLKFVIEERSPNIIIEKR